MKIYTKTGDKGKTSLVGGKRVSKGHDRINVYGTVDELNSFIGMIRDHNSDEGMDKVLHKIQNELFVVGSRLASEAGKSPNYLSEIDNEQIIFLEGAIDSMNEELEPLKNFILPGGHPLVSYCHIARCVCRRAERLAVNLAESEELEENIIVYLNRLSDFLFTLARKFSKDLGVDEILWSSK
ncbi:MAG: cob(I)yrinic acid a,c-diamide adenosyltransferase [Chitinophagales bacterium]|nr:cob(I)yrinic acid a,c-diamide adenosyltransferase [Chitinophagales bacterium]